jgi:hypothetical protein
VTGFGSRLHPNGPGCLVGEASIQSNRSDFDSPLVSPCNVHSFTFAHTTLWCASEFIESRQGRPNLAQDASP